MKKRFALLLLGILMLTVILQVGPACAGSTDEYVAYQRIKEYEKVEACALTDGIGNCIGPVKHSFDIIGVLQIEEKYTVYRVELYGSGCEKPVMLYVNGVWKDVSCFQDSQPYCWETLTFDIIPTQSIKIFSTEHSSVARHGFHLMWVKLYVHKSTEATVDFEPDVLNLRSGGIFITAYIELDNADVREIDASTVLLNRAIPPVLDEKYGFVTSEDSYITDHDEDGELERMLKFWRSEVLELLGPCEEINITISGQLVDGLRFEGSDVLRTMAPRSMLTIELGSPGTSLGSSRPTADMPETVTGEAWQASLNHQGFVSRLYGNSMLRRAFAWSY